MWLFAGQMEVFIEFVNSIFCKTDLSGDPKRRKMMFQKEMESVIDKTKQQLLRPKGVLLI